MPVYQSHATPDSTTPGAGSTARISFCVTKIDPVTQEGTCNQSDTRGECDGAFFSQKSCEFCKSICGDDTSVCGECTASVGSGMGWCLSRIASYYGYSGGENDIPNFSTAPTTLTLASKSVGLLPQPLCTICGDCELDDYLWLFVNYYNMITVMFGATALLFLVIGGVVLLLSRGNPEAVQRGKKMVLSTLIGIAILLLSFMIVNAVISVLTGVSIDQVKIFGNVDWFNPFGQK